MRDEKRTPVILLGTSTLDGLSDSNDVLRFSLTVAYLNEDGELRNYLSSSSFDNEPFADLKVSAQADALGDSGPYGWRAEYGDVFSVNLDRAETMVKTLRRLARGLEKLDAELGYCETFTAYVARVAKVLGVKSFGWKVDGGSSLYAANTYHYGDARQFGAQIDRAVHTFRKARTHA